MKNSNWKAVSELGATLIEAGLMIALVSAVSIAALRGLGDEVGTEFCELAGSVDGGYGGTLTYDPETNTCGEDIRTIPPCPPGWIC